METSVCTILIGVDASARSEDAVALAGFFARAGAAHVLLAHVAPANGPARDEGQLTANRLAGMLTGLEPERVRTCVIAGSSPAHGIHDLAVENAATVVVVGSTRRGAIGRVYPGSTGERLLSGSPCAVAVAPQGYRTQAGAAIEQVGVAYDGSTEARGALAAAASTAAALGAQLTLVSVVPESFYATRGLVAGGEDGPLHDLAEHDIRSDLDEALARLPGAASVVLDGRPSEQLTEATRSLDLLFLGSRAYGPLHAVLEGATSGAVMRSARCPVIVLPRGAEAPFAHLFDREAAAPS